ncbi:MAG: RNA polymerase factor sigma-54 [Caldisericia bacterium]|nr:RNA polymerase factor sigma-54 [Caldisericia bacterium]
MKSRVELKSLTKLSQNLYLRQNLIQLMNILYYPAIELREILINRFEENPFLEIENNDFDELPDDFNIEDLEDKESKGYLDSFIKEEKTFKDYLEDQLILFNFDEIENKVAKYLIGNIDDIGLLRIDINDIKKDLKVGKEKILKVLNTLKNELHPPGVLACNEKESILIQLIRNNLIDKKEIKKWEEIIDKFLKNEELDEKYLNKLSKVYIYPTKIFERSLIMYILPELYLEKEGNSLKVIYNDSIIPKVKFNEELYNNIKSRIFELTKEEREFFKNKVKDAKDLIYLISEREEKILNVANFVIQKQKNFFLKDGYLENITLKEIANELNISISTVSRILNEKYIETPKGVFPLKFFLGKEKLKKGVFGTKIKMMIKDLIENENKEKPFSDGDIAKILNERGIFIKRRTVAKYREELNIPPKNKRKIK